MEELCSTHFNCLTPDRKPVRWNPPEVVGDVLVDSLYMGGALAAMDRRLQNGSELTFYLTQDLEELPSYGPGVVALVIGDESIRVPAYFDKVLAIFRNTAVRPLLTSSPFRDPSYVNLWWLVAHLRAWKRHGPGAYAYLQSKFLRPGGHPAPIWLLPTGVFNQKELPITPLADRGADIFFAGSVAHRASASDLRNRMSPKVLARQNMVTHAQKLAADHPELNVNLITTGDFYDSLGGDPDAYSNQLMDARVALVPRGAIADTARFWEAMRYGCVAVADTVARHRVFYDDAPVVRLRDWRDLQDTVVPLLADTARLEDLHRRSLEWWRTKGAPEAVGAYMAAKINALPR